MKQTIQIPSLEDPISLEETVGNFERNLIIQALKKCDWGQTRAAKRLGTTRRILRYRMDKLDISVPPQKHS